MYLRSNKSNAFLVIFHLRNNLLNFLCEPDHLTFIKSFMRGNESITNTRNLVIKMLIQFVYRACLRRLRITLRHFFDGFLIGLLSLIELGCQLSEPHREGYEIYIRILHG